MAKHTSETTSSFLPIKAELYIHSAAHYAVALGNHAELSRIISSLPQFPDPAQIHTESQALANERIINRISAVLDRRDVPFRETPLHLAVRLNDLRSARALAVAGADISLHNAAGWNPLQEALCRRATEIAQLLVKFHHRSAWAKWRRRLPLLLAALRRMRDFYMEISFHFESSVIPFVGKIAPSDTYRIWKREGNLRADTSLSGFDGLKILRANQSFLFLGDGDFTHRIAPGSLLVLNRDNRTIFDAFANVASPMTDSDAAGICSSETSVYRPGMDVTKAEFVGRMNWRRQEKTESVGEWKARVYEVHNVIFNFRSRKIGGGCGRSSNADSDTSSSEKVLSLELDEDDEGFLVAENLNFGSVSKNSDKRRHSSFVKEEREWIPTARKSVDVMPSMAAPPPRMSSGGNNAAVPKAAQLPVQKKEKEYVKSLRPSVWLTEQFPLKTDELLPLLDILANKVKAVRRLRELVTTKLPPGSFPVKVAIPVVPTVRVVITFTKFVDLQPPEKFYTPFSSPSNLLLEDDHHGDDKNKKPKSSLYSSFSSSSSSSSVGSSWLRRNSSHNKQQQQRCSSSMALDSDPFAIPAGYRWIKDLDDKSRKTNKSKSVKKSK